jgi:hypothetical protein
MQRVLFAAAIALVFGAAPIAAQTRVSVAVGFGVPRPFVTGVVVVGRPYGVYPPHRYFRYRQPVIIVRRYPVARYRHHHRRHYYYDGY